MTRSRRLRALAALLCGFGPSAGCDHHAESRATESDRTLTVAQRVDHLDGLAREPMIVEHASGTLFVAGYSLQQRPRPQLWKSDDHGATWSRVDVGAGAQGAGDSDVDLAVGPDGNVYQVVMDFDRDKGEGRSVSVGVTSDVGATWTWTTLSRTRFDDRPWVAVAPDGTAHVIWNDGHGVRHAVSDEGGRTWNEGTRISDLGGSSHLAVGPNGEVAVRISPASASGNRVDPEVDLVAVSTDGGTTWEKHPPPSHLDWTQPTDMSPGVTIPRWVEPLAWDSAGRLYDEWTDSTGVWLARSADRGATWTTWRVAEGPHMAFYPYLIARGPGELAATWFSEDLDALRSTPDSADLRWHVALITVGDTDAPPRVTQSPPLPTDAFRTWVVDGDTLSGPDTGGEYVALTFLREGGLGAVTPIQDLNAHRMGFTFWRLEAR
jgi:BNR/Asp-box repeat